MGLETVLFLFTAGVLGGASNAIAGGGTFFTFPALISVGLDPLTANASNAVAIYPGHAAAVPAYRRELVAARKQLVERSALAALGGLFGAGLLVATGSALFSTLVPWLLLASTMLFAFAPYIAKFSTRQREAIPGLAGLIQFLFALYGGYFGAGLGILLMAGLAIIGESNIQMANAQKNWLAMIITSVSVVTFAIAGAISWPQTLSVLLGAVIGGLVGARVAKFMPPHILRAIIVAVGLALSWYYFAR